MVDIMNNLYNFTLVILWGCLFISVATVCYAVVVIKYLVNLEFSSLNERCYIYFFVEIIHLHKWIISTCMKGLDYNGIYSLMNNDEILFL